MSDRWSTFRLQDNGLELLVLPGIGGRLWDIKFRGQSLLFQNLDLIGLSIDDAELTDLPTRSPQFKFPLWGGEKTWIAPDTAWKDSAPFPALDSEPYRINAQGADYIEMESEICPLSELSISRRIELRSPTEFSIEHTVTNHGVNPRPTGIWSVMMIDTPASIYVAADKPAIHPVFGDADSFALKTDAGVAVDCNQKCEFKVGVPNPNGETLIKVGSTGATLTCSTAEPGTDDRFAHEMPVEIFNSGDYDYCEAEWHSPIAELSPAEEMRFRQIFEFKPEDDAQILETYGKLL